MAERNPFDTYRAARQNSFRLLQDLRTRSDDWLTAAEATTPDWATVAHFEGLNMERERIIADLHSAEQDLVAFLMKSIEAERPAT